MKEIIILGTAPSLVHCPFDCEVYGVNGAYMSIDHIPEKSIFRLDKLFLTDTLFNSMGKMLFNIDDINALNNKYGTEVISMHRMKLGNHTLKAKKYPYERITKKFRNNYFTSTIGYMIAYALDQHTRLTENKHGIKIPVLTEPLRLKLYGIDMITKIEYQQQKGGVEFWLGYAISLGCEREIAEGSTIMVPPTGTPYGIEIKYDLKLIDPQNILGWRKQ